MSADASQMDVPRFYPGGRMVGKHQWIDGGTGAPHPRDEGWCGRSSLPRIIHV